jgi:hypothetical protein
MLGVPGVGKRVIEHRVLQTALMVGSGQGEKSRLTASELKD